MTAPHPEAALSAREVLSSVLDEYDRNICTHEETYRGGSIWTVCHQCGSKWADDEGGFQPHVDPPAIARARKIVCDASTALTATAGDGGLREAAQALLTASIEDYGLDEEDADDEPVAVGVRDDDEEWKAAVTFGHLRGLQAALAQAPAVGAPAGVVLAEMTDEAALRNAFAEGVDWARKNPTPTDAQPKAASPVGDEALREALKKVVSSALYKNQFKRDWREHIDPVANAVLAALASHPTTGQETGAWVISNGKAGSAERWRCWGEWGPTWAPDTDSALQFARRIDAERFCAEDESAWRLTNLVATGQETVAIPRDGGVREASPGAEALRQAYDAGFNSTGDGWDADIADAQDDPTYKSERDIVVERILEAEMLSRLATPSPAQEPGTGDTGEIAGSDRFIACMNEEYISWRDSPNGKKYGPRPPRAAFQAGFARGYERATPATAAETRGPAGQTKGGL